MTISEADALRRTARIAEFEAGEEWCEEKEMVTMLRLAIAQLETTMTQADGSAQGFTAAVIAMLEAAGGLEQEVAALGSRAPGVQATCDVLKRCARETIVASQYYDVMVQRLAHIRDGLFSLATHMADNSLDTSSPAQWTRMRESLRSTYKMEEERVVFDAVMNGDGVAEALQRFAKRAQDEGAGGPELF